MNTAEEEVCSSHSVGSMRSRDIDRERDHQREGELPQSPSHLKTNLTESAGQHTGKETPIRVRDMINLYNFATQKNQELEQAKSIYFGSRSDTEQAQNEEGAFSPVDKTKTGAADPQSLKEESSTSSSVEKSYQSKTTIRRTDQGVRIIIDIFFDKKESEVDIVGSRVETDIPESRILAEFQQHSLAMQKKEHQPGYHKQQLGGHASSAQAHWD